MVTDLSVLVVSEGRPEAWPFIGEAEQLAVSLGAEFVLALDTHDWADTLTRDQLGAIRVDSKTKRVVFVDSHGAGYWAACANQGFDACRRRYVFRLDDDERASPGLVAWLREWVRHSTAADQYTFNRAALWPDADHRIDAPPWWPDPQMRLALRERCYRSTLHEPWTGEVVTVPHEIEHHTYIVHDNAWHERRRVAYAKARPDWPYPMPDDRTKVVAV